MLAEALIKLYAYFYYFQGSEEEAGGPFDPRRLPGQGGGQLQSGGHLRAHRRRHRQREL